MILISSFYCRFISFCRVGTGLSDEELDAVVTKLKPFFRKSEYPKKAPPSFYEVTNNSKERPDVWIESPEKSIILSITSDIRTIRSEVFSAPYSLRFPRIDRVRYDKPWHECLDVQSFVELVHSSNGTTQKGAGYGAVRDNKPKCMKSSRKGEKRSVFVVPQHFVQTDVSHIKGETLIFSNMVFYFVNMPPTHSLDSLHKMVAENGGTFSMNLNNSVTHSIAAESKGIKFQAAKLRGDIIHYSWLFDCCSHKKLLPLQTKYFLFLSDSSRKKLQEEIDEFSDPYFGDLDIEDIKQVIDFRTPVFDFCTPKNSDSKVLIELALRRMKLEVSMGGGKVSNSLSQATHLVVISPLGFDVDFNSILRRNWSRECTIQFTKVAMEGEVASVAIKPLNLLIRSLCFLALPSLACLRQTLEVRDLDLRRSNLSPTGFDWPHLTFDRLRHRLPDV
ncbi:DNA ligase IV [Actinidia rufa]|uniref:DNA ligase IV n=1 Tax=Actinidia rufa TaxID=165716 RepID=A0A7J0HFP6_9ERIC|nr:DNA ligase IV [Actinidia rufa]